MYQGTRWVLLKQKKRSRKSHDWAPLRWIAWGLVPKKNIYLQWTNSCEEPVLSPVGCYQDNDLRFPFVSAEAIVIAVIWGDKTIYLLNAERLNVEWPNAEWPNAERPNTEWPNTELDPTPNRDPTSNDQTPKGTERRKTEHRIWTLKDWTPKIPRLHKLWYHCWIF